MHLLATEAGLAADGTEPVDPGQDPAEILFLSAADTELSCLAAANAALRSGRGFLRLTQLAWLSHPFSVDRYMDQTVPGAKLVIVRALGGHSYWHYCLDRVATALTNTDVMLAVLPGDTKHDDELMQMSTLPPIDWRVLFAYCRFGGLDNARNLLLYCRHLIHGNARPDPPQPAPNARLYHTPNASRSSEGSTRPVGVILFYRSLLQAGNLEPVNALADALESRGLRPLPIAVTSLKDPESAAVVRQALAANPPAIIVNMTCFSSTRPVVDNRDWEPGLLSVAECPVLQVALAATDSETWQNSKRGLVARDLAMSIALTEMDGNVFTRAIAFKSQPRIDPLTQLPIALHEPVADRIAYVADLATHWTQLRKTPASDRKIALLLANYPVSDGRLANGVGLDTPASATATLAMLAHEGYAFDDAPRSAADLMALLRTGPTNARATSDRGASLTIEEYDLRYSDLPRAVRAAVEERWGGPMDDPRVQDEAFRLAIHAFGNLAIGIQPARGYNIDPQRTYHCPDLVPPHNYFAFYFWLTQTFGVHAVIHMGKHGNLEWLPGKAHGLSASCCPEAILGPVPNVYPFIVNDPGEGSQAKRRIHSVIIDHLTPPMARAESHGKHRDIEVLLDELYEAMGLDQARAKLLEEKILTLLASTSLDMDIGIVRDDPPAEQLRKTDAYLCELKESQIRDGLHVFGQSPGGSLEHSLMAAILRTPRGDGTGANESLLRALARDLGMATAFDPLDCPMAEPWQDVRPTALQAICSDPWRTQGDTVERLEHLGQTIIAGKAKPPGPASATVIAHATDVLRPQIAACGDEELRQLKRALDGRFVPPGTAGAPTRGRPDVLPTGRNFHSIDSRALPRKSAWELGVRSAALLVERYRQDHGEWPTSMAITAWGTANMRTGGDDLAQAMALIGAQPRWDDTSGRVLGFEIRTPVELGRPRVDVTLRVSGMFRDAFPAQMDLFAGAARAVMERDEPVACNPARAAWLRDCELMGDEAAAFRVFGSPPGAYGAGLQTLVDEGFWARREQFGRTYIEWGHCAYGGPAQGQAEKSAFTRRLGSLDAVIQNQDNREHDLLDSDDYYQFEGGLAAAVEMVRGEQPVIYHNDHSRPERPVIRTLEAEIARVVRSRAINPKWIAGVKRHGYKGAFEMAATLDYLFAFAATTGAAKSHHFDLVYAAYIADMETRAFIQDHNPDALQDMAARFLEAVDRNLWHPRSNSSLATLQDLVARPPTA